MRVVGSVVGGGWDPNPRCALCEALQQPPKGLHYDTSTVRKAEWVSNKMEGLADTTWDVVIEGTGLEQSLLAL